MTLMKELSKGVSNDPTLWGEMPDGTRLSWSPKKDETSRVNADNLLITTYVGLTLAAVTNIASGITLSLSTSGYNYSDTPGIATAIHLGATFTALALPPVLSLINDLGTAGLKTTQDANSNTYKIDREPIPYRPIPPSIEI